MGLGRVKRRLGIRRIKKEYWVTDLPPYYANQEGPFTSCGPYESLEEATADRNGLQRFFDKNGDDIPDEESNPQQHQIRNIKEIYTRKKTKSRHNEKVPTAKATAVEEPADFW